MTHRPYPAMKGFGDLRWLEGAAPAVQPAPPILGGITSEDEEEELEAANGWVKEQGLPDGILSYEYVDPDTGEQQAIFDLAWPHGIQEELSQPVVLLLNEPTETIALANRAGFRCFTSSDDLKKYVKSEILTEVDA